MSYRSVLLGEQAVSKAARHRSNRCAPACGRCGSIEKGSGAKAGVHLRRALGFGNTSDFDPFLLLDDFRNDIPEDRVTAPNRSKRVPIDAVQSEH
jgi:hypothetical protein